MTDKTTADAGVQKCGHCGFPISHGEISNGKMGERVMTQVLVLDPAVEFKPEELNALRDAGILIIRAMPGQVRLLEAESLPFSGNDMLQVAIRVLANYAVNTNMEPAAKFVIGLNKMFEAQIGQTGK